MWISERFCFSTNLCKTWGTLKIEWERAERYNRFQAMETHLYCINNRNDGITRIEALVRTIGLYNLSGNHFLRGRCTRGETHILVKHTDATYCGPLTLPMCRTFKLLDARKAEPCVPTMCLSGSNSRLRIILSVAKYLLTGLLRTFRLMEFRQSSLHSARGTYLQWKRLHKWNQYAIQHTNHFEASIKNLPNKEERAWALTRTQAYTKIENASENKYIAE